MLHIIDDSVYLFDERYTKNFVTMYYYYFHTQLVSPTGSVSIVINEDDTVNIEKTSFICKIENPFYYSYNYEYYLDRDLILRKRERKQVNNNRLVYDINISKKYLTQAIEEIGVGVSFGVIIEYIRNKVENIKEKSPTCIIFHNNRGYIISEAITGPRAVNKYKSIVAARIFDKMSYRDRISATVIKEHMSLYSDNIYTDINCREVVFNIDQRLVGQFNVKRQNLVYDRHTGIDKVADKEKEYEKSYTIYNLLNKKLYIKVNKSMALSIIRELLHYGQTGIFEENAEYKIQGKTYIIHNNKFEYLGKPVDGRKYWSDIIYIMNRGINKIQTGSTVDDTIQALDNDIEDAINNQLNEKFKNIWRERRNNHLLGLDKLKEPYRHELANLVNYIVGPEIHSSRKGKNFEYIKVFIYLSYISRFDILSKLVRKYTKIFNRAVLMLLKNSDKFKSYGIPINMLKYDAVLRRDGIIEYTLSLKDINTMKEE